ncbi:MAG TPA: ABC transporter permease [Chloroflexota bacterium]|nr:ABC transporter permease [Chloroflexota bacterium]
MQSDVIARTAEQTDPSQVPGAVVDASRLKLPVWAIVLLGNPLSLIGCVMFVAIVALAAFAPLLTHFDPNAMIAPLSQAPTATHPFGTNQEGEDILSQVLYGARFSLAVGLGVGFAIAFLATAIGMAAGYAGGWVDDTLTLLMNIFLIIPQLPLLIVIGTYIPLHSDIAAASALVMTAVITLTGWAWGARVIRAQTLSLRNRDFVQAAIVTGEPAWRIIFVEMLPNMTSLIVNTVILSTMGGILTEAGLDYLGVGNVNQVTWGAMLFKAQADSDLFMGAWWGFVFPGLAIALTVMSMILINNGLDAISNPRLRKVPRRKTVRSVVSPPEPAGVEAVS